MRAVDSKIMSNVAAAAVTADVFSLRGGAYGVTIIASNFGTANLQRLSADGSTYVNVSTDTNFAANGYASVVVPEGTYRINASGITAAYISVQRIPGE